MTDIDRELLALEIERAAKEAEDKARQSQRWMDAKSDMSVAMALLSIRAELRALRLTLEINQ